VKKPALVLSMNMAPHYHPLPLFLVREQILSALPLSVLMSKTVEESLFTDQAPMQRTASLHVFRASLGISISFHSAKSDA
jgi:hypothetical protein